MSVPLPFGCVAKSPASIFFFPPLQVFFPTIFRRKARPRVLLPMCGCDTHPWVVLPEGLQQAFGFGHLSLASPCGVRAAVLPQTKLPGTVKNRPNTVNIMQQLDEIQDYLI